MPISTVMRRLLTGYALWYNRKHRRHGHVFQNRFKSILCQEDTYFLELVRYIHLNPIRAGLVEARSLLCYWAVRELGETMSSLARKLGISIPSVSDSVARGQKIAQEKGCSLLKT